MIIVRHRQRGFFWQVGSGGKGVNCAGAVEGGRRLSMICTS